MPAGLGQRIMTGLGKNHISIALLGLQSRGARPFEVAITGLLVSEETVKDFQLSPGDMLRLRLQNVRTKQLTTIPFHYIGVVKEFPTADEQQFQSDPDQHRLLTLARTHPRRHPGHGR